MLKIQNRRCRFCNWLNKEVSEDFVCKNCNKENGKVIKEEVVKEQANWLDEVDEIKGVGPETFADIKRLYSTKEQLIEDLKTNKAPFRNDIVKKLNLYFTL